MSEKKNVSGMSLGYMPGIEREFIGRYLAGSQNDISQLHGGNVASISVLGELSTKLRGVTDPDKPFGVFTKYMDENLKWLEAAAMLKDEAGDKLSAFGYDSTSLDVLATYLRSMADDEANRQIVAKYIQPHVDKRVEAYQKVSSSQLASE